ncbi:glutamine amidotransferase [Bordetella sp. BOR01]|uniref:glutamine amidotransferase n=1 Tax=Bordetella sp. BOR01 TaxID=2854779 RepID=UPI001C44DC57|nr:glutamine amidotransferase [Bordetella sp. BOR01]MBV7485963.1 glutamine amidotransferase [Bordetella sp. BOR01]
MNAPAASTLPVLILHTGDPDDALRLCHGDYAQMLRHAAGLEPEAAHIVRVHAGEQPLAPSAYRAALITGSPAMVTDHEPWSEQAAAWLQQAALAGTPIFGVCYGHQLLAHALGGAVDYNPQGRELGTQAIECLPAAAGDPLMSGLPVTFPAQLLHAQTVTRLPAGAVALARSALDAHQLVRWSPRVYSAQFHPEFGPEFMHDHLQRYQADYAREGLDAARLASTLRPTPTAAGLLRRFLGLRQSATAARP